MSIPAQSTTKHRRIKPWLRPLALQAVIIKIKTILNNKLSSSQPLALMLLIISPKTSATVAEHTVNVSRSHNAVLPLLLA
jgi:hypothetical protein